MYASFENVKESGLSVERRVGRRVERRVGRRLSCRRLKDFQNSLFTGFFADTAAGKPPPHKPLHRLPLLFEIVRNGY